MNAPSARSDSTRALFHECTSIETIHLEPTVDTRGVSGRFCGTSHYSRCLHLRLIRGQRVNHIVERVTAVDFSTGSYTLHTVAVPAFHPPLVVKRERSEKRFVFFLVSPSTRYELRRIVLSRSTRCEWKKGNAETVRKGSTLRVNWWDNRSCRKSYLPLTSVRVFAPSKLVTIERS